ncbi:MAG: response regulator [Calditrichaeota bacterium]|nr:MAG: response regulator [Calditrichota bacterium]
MSSKPFRPQIHVLVVDDDPVIRHSFLEILEAQDYRVSTATDGYQALELAQHDPPDLIFLDVIMPQMDGFETLAELRKIARTRSIPVIVVTARADAATLIQALKLGATDFIAKPFLKGDVLRKVKYALMNRQQRRQLTEITLTRNTSTFTSGGKSFERMKNHFILNFENIYLNMVELIAEHRKEELQKVITRLLDSVRFYELNMVKEEIMRLLVHIGGDRWDEAAGFLERIYNIFLELRRSLPEAN